MNDESNQANQGPEPTGEGGSGAEPSGAERGASRDLAEGLELVLRAARKAVHQVESVRLDELGRRALGSLESLDKRKMGELGRKAVKNLDPRRVEEIAEEAGRELISVVERVADRVEEILSGSKPAPKAPAASAEPSPPESEATSDEAQAPARKIRVDEP